MPMARITSKGQVTVPKEIRQRLGVEPGDALEFLFRNGHVEIVPVRRRRVAEFRGIFPTSEPLDFTAERERAWDAMAEDLGVSGDEPDDGA